MAEWAIRRTACEDLPRRRAADYIWLVYAVFFFIEPVLRRNAVYWAECLTIFAAFVGMYVWYVETPRREVRLALLGVMVLFGVATVHFNIGGTYFFIFAAAWGPFVVDSLRRSVWLLVADAVGVAGCWAVLRENPINFAIAFGFIFVVGLANLFAAEQKRAGVRLREAQAENAALAAMAERERIARDLHDVLGHTLSVIVLKAELAGRLIIRDPPRAAAEIADVEHTARTALAEVREAIGGYRGQGLKAEMAMARHTLDAAGVALTLAEVDSAPTTLSAEAQTVLSLTLREAVTNIVRHARATHCRVSFTTAAGRHALIVEDDGVHLVAREGNGLRGMRERVQQVGGRFSLNTSQGTTVRVDIPAATGL